MTTPSSNPDDSSNSVAGTEREREPPQHKSSPDHRGIKRTKTDGKSTTAPRKRVPTACENCRLRKTKCDGVKPVCGSCARMGVECVGGDEKELSLYERTSLRILEGIDRIEGILRTQNAPPPSPAGTANNHCAAITTVNTMSSPAAALSNLCAAAAANSMSPPGVSPAMAVSPALSYQSTASIVTAMHEAPSPLPAIHTLFDSNSTMPGTSRIKTPSKLDRILAWSVFPRTSPYCGLVSNGNWRESLGEEMHLGLDEVRVLHMRYLERFHPNYPIINIESLNKAICSTLEGKGCGWDSEACLMLLCCALGAVADDYFEHFYNRETTRDPQRSRLERIARAEGYWCMAKRRLGIVMLEETELAGQCLALAGFWYLYQLDPISAYKMFHSACLSWQTLHLAQGRSVDVSRVEVDGVSSGMSHPQYLKQRLYWTCLKAEFELRAELSLPVPTGAQLEYPLHFPSPPASFGPAPGGAVYLDTERLWYFYTAEIFLRRLHNRLVDEVTSFEAYLLDPQMTLTEKRLTSLITIVREYEVYVSQWHASLPVSIRFPDPAISQQPLPDERQQFIRKRFLDCHELLYRPFLNLTLNYPGWPGYIVAPHPKSSRNQPRDPVKLEADVRLFSTLALQYTYWSIAADRGVWFQHSTTVWRDVRNRLADVLVLRAAAKAGMELPMHWEEVVEDAEAVLLYWCTGDGEDESVRDRRRRAGLKGCAEVVTWAREIM